MMDSLIQFLLEEIAMDGDEGSDVSRLDSFVTAYYDTTSSAGQGPILKSSTQKLDSHFLTYVWNRLIEQEEIRIAVIEPIDPSENGSVEPEKLKKGKGKAKAKVVESTERLRDLTEEEIESGKEFLVEKFGEDLRIVTSGDATWAAITGSHERVSAITPPVYSILQMVSRARGKGVTVIELGKTLNIDQKSAFHYIKAGVALGIVKKFRTVDFGAWTNRILHIRYLSVSPEWAIFTTSDQHQDSDVAVNSSDEDAGRGTRLQKIGAEFLTENTGLVKGRVLRVLKGCEEYIISRLKLPEAIGLYGISRKDRRSLNSIVDRLAEGGLVQKVLIEQPAKRSQGRTSALVSVNYLQLTDAGLKSLQSGGTMDEAEPEEVMEDHSALLGNVPWERQILDLLGEADVEGMKNKDLSFALGGLNRRTIDQALARLSKDPPPSHLLDMTVNSVYETIGREKFLKYFLRSAYLRRILRDGISEKEAGVDINGLGSVGGWGELEAIGTYDKVSDLDKFIGGVDIYQQAGGTSSHKGTELISKKKKIKAPTKPRKVPSVQKPVRKVDAKVVKEVKEPKVVKKKLAAEPIQVEPRVLKLGKNGKPSYYARSVQEAKDRAAAGLPPKEKRPASGGGRKKKVSTAELVDGEQDGIEAVVEEVTTPKLPGPAAVLDESDDSIEPVASTSQLQPEPIIPPEVLPTPQPELSQASQGKGKGKAVEPESAITHPKKRLASSEPLESTSPLKRITPATASATSNKKSKLKPIEIKTKRVNITGLARQKELMTYLESCGGIAELVRTLGDKVFNHFKGIDVEVAVQNGQMDYKILLDCVTALVGRDVLKKRVSMLEGGLRKDLIHLPRIEGDSEEMNKFVKGLSANESNARHKYTLQIPYIAPIRNDSKDLENSFEVPEEDDEYDKVKLMFEKHSGVLGARFGVFYGRFARARALHEFLIEFMNSDEESAKKFMIQDDGGGGQVFKAELLFEAIPLGLWLRLVPLPIPISTTFDEFLTIQSNSELPLSEIPKEMKKIIEPKLSKRKDHIYIILRSLIELKVLQPLLLNKEKKLENVNGEKLASHWLMRNKLPIYSFGNSENPRLTSILNSNNLEEVKKYWGVLREYSVHYVAKKDDLPSILQNDENFGEKFEGTNSFKKLINSKTKWQDFYMLLNCQRQYLERLNRRAMNPIDIENIDDYELQRIAKSILAPVEVTREFLVKKNNLIRVGALRSKKRKVSKGKQKATGDQDADQEEEEEEGEVEELVPARSREETQLALQEKAKKSSTQRDLIFMSFYNKFNRENNNPIIEDKILDYLKRRFTSSTNGIGTKVLESEFKFHGKLDTSSTYRSIVPQSVQKILDPYDVPIVNESKSKSKPTVKKQTPAALVRATPFISASDQHEFLTLPILPVPVLSTGQRLPRNFFTSEQADLCLDAACILKTRCSSASKTISWEPMTQLFKGLPAGKMRQLYLRLVEKKEDFEYFERLMGSWEAVYEAGRESGELIDEIPGELIRFDLSYFIRFLRRNIDKPALKLAGPIQRTLPNLRKLPGTFEELVGKYNINLSLSSNSSNARFESYSSAAGSKAREVLISNLALSSSIPYIAVKNEERAQEHGVEMAIKKFRTILVTKVEDYDPELANEIIKSSTDFISLAHSKLIVDGVIGRKHSELARVTPGTNFTFTQNFNEGFNFGLSAPEIDSIREKELELMNCSDEKVGLLVEDAEMIPILRAFSENQISFEVDIEASFHHRRKKDEREKLEEQVRAGQLENTQNEEGDGDNQPKEVKKETRKYSDISLELEVTVSTQLLLNTPIQPIEVTEPRIIELCGDSEILQATLDNFLTLTNDDLRESTDFRTMNVVLASAGMSGIAIDELMRQTQSSRSTVLDLAQKATSTDPPLAFWSGHESLVLISSMYSDQWTISISPDSAQSEEKEILPALWIDIRGNVVKEFWLKVRNWIKLILAERPGYNLLQLYKESKRNSLLSVGEILYALNELTMGEEIRRGSDEAVDWEKSCWYIV